MTRTTRKNQTNFFVITGVRNVYAVTLERKNNTSYGAPRWHAVIAVLLESGEKILTDGSRYNAVYDFVGHYFSAIDESRWIVDYYESETAEAEK